MANFCLGVIQTSNAQASRNAPCSYSARRAGCLRFPAPLNDLIQSPHSPLSRTRQINFHTQGFTVEVINQIEKPKAAPIR